MASELRERLKPGTVFEGDIRGKTVVGYHPGGDIKHGGPVQLLRMLLFVTYSLLSCISYIFPSAKPNNR